MAGFCVKGTIYLLLSKILHAAYKCQIETHSKTVFEKEGGTATVELSFGDDGNAVAQQVGLVHVVSGQNHCTACTRVKVLLFARHQTQRKFSAHSKVNKKYGSPRLSSAFANRC